MEDKYDEFFRENEVNGLKPTSQREKKNSWDEEGKLLDYQYSAWGLCESFSIEHAAILSCGHLPEQYPFDFAEWEVQNWPTGLYATYTAIKHAVISNNLEASKQYSTIEEWGKERTVLDTSRTTIPVAELLKWFQEKEKTPYFFYYLKARLDFDEIEGNKPGYLDVTNSKFSLKLKAAVDAWEAVSSLEELKISPKEAIKEWLRGNAEQYGLTKDDGTLNETGIEEIAKVAHWRTKGGALKTPNKLETEPPPPPF